MRRSVHRLTSVPKRQEIFIVSRYVELYPCIQSYSNSKDNTPEKYEVHFCAHWISSDYSIHNKHMEVAQSAKLDAES